MPRKATSIDTRRAVNALEREFSDFVDPMETHVYGQVTTFCYPVRLLQSLLDSLICSAQRRGC